MTKLIRVGVSLCLLSGVVACGDDSSDGVDEETAEGTSGRGGRGGRGGTGVAGTGGAGLIPDLTDLLTPMCNPDVENVTSCGGTDCPALPAGSDATCTITCCSDDNRCGTRSSDTRLESLLGTTCTAPALPDERCPSVALGGTSLAGCCTANGTCGQILADICLPSIQMRACDAPPSVDDAGI